MLEVRAIEKPNRAGRLSAAPWRCRAGFSGLRIGSIETKLQHYPNYRAHRQAQKGMEVCRGNDFAYAVGAARRIKHQVRSDEPEGFALSPGLCSRWSEDVHKRLEPQGGLGLEAIVLSTLMHPTRVFPFPRMPHSAVSMAIEEESKTCP